MSEDKKRKEMPNSMGIEIDEKTGQGIYSNLAVLTHSNSDFVLDFVRVMPGLPKAKVQSRIIMNPDNAKRLLLALQDNIAKYEKAHGTINLNSSAQPQTHTLPIKFGDGGADA